MHNNEVEVDLKMNKLLHVLEDMHPYSVARIASLLDVSEDKVALFLRFLAKYNIITYDEAEDTVVICTDFFALM
jgi:predicted transcriptional regulator